MKLSVLQAQAVFSVSPLFTEKDAFVFPQAESKWALDKNDTVVIKKTGDNFYHLQYGKANNPSQYEAVFLKAGNTTLLDIAPKISDTLGSSEYRKQLQCLHSFLKIKIEKDTLWVAELNHSWFYNQFKKNKNLLTHFWREGSLIITATSNELQNFIEAHINDSAFFDNPFSFVRVYNVVDRPPTFPSKYQIIDPTVNPNQKCSPSFFLKNGWLGGDGDASLPVNEKQSLFIFSDTYVGQKNDSSREGKGYTIVSNTVGVANCMPDGKYNIQYYWKDMYTTHPKPVFESFTNRYRYWINAAFMHNGSLYVLMPKIGPGLNDDGCCDFSILGSSLAKVTDPMSTSPDKWTPELIPFTFFDNSNNYDLHSLAEDGKFIYLFTDKASSQTVLLRLPLNYIDSPKGHIEYYSASHLWKTGIDTSDMMTILPERPGNTINFHSDIKKWVMVCGPGFFDKRIRLRTATDLTGPWSESVTVYECPELTPGTPEYSKNNYCYWGRELFQYYDKNTRSMLLTYDPNNSNSTEIKLNPKIYTPKVITVPLAKYGIR